MSVKGDMLPEYEFDYLNAKPNRFAARSKAGASIEMDWLEPWRPLSDPARALLLEERLGKEVVAGHALHGVKVAAIGVADHPDDILFRLLDGTGRYATVHLTWHRGDADWPHTRLFENENDWLERGLRADHEEFNEMRRRTDPT
jgi:hypothetical protein